MYFFDVGKKFTSYFPSKVTFLAKDELTVVGDDFDFKFIQDRSTMKISWTVKSINAVIA